MVRLQSLQSQRIVKSNLAQKFRGWTPINLPWVRCAATVKVGGTSQAVWRRNEMPMARIMEFFKDEKLCILGYGTLGIQISQKLCANGLNVVLGVPKTQKSWLKARNDGWIPDKNLLDLPKAIKQSTIIFNLVADAAQSILWPQIRSLLEDKTIVFSHGFGIVYKDLTGLEMPENVDVILVAPQGPSISSFAVFQDYSCQAKKKAIMLGFAAGASSLYETTFEKETFSDLVGERGVLLGAMNGLILAQYQTLRENGHSPAEAYMETVEQATESLYPLLGEKGMQHLLEKCSTTARRGALDWTPRFYDATKGVFEDLYESVKNGSEAKRVLEYNSNRDIEDMYRQQGDKVQNLEIWRVGEAVRKLR